MNETGKIQRVVPYEKRQQYIEQQIQHDCGVREIKAGGSGAQISPTNISTCGKTELLKRFRLIDDKYVREMTGLNMDGSISSDQKSALTKIFAGNVEYENNDIVYVPSGGVSLKAMKIDDGDGVLIMSILRGCMARLYVMSYRQKIEYNSTGSLDDLLYNPAYNIGDIGDYGFVKGIGGGGATTDDSFWVGKIVDLLLDKIKDGNIVGVTTPSQPDLVPSPDNGPPPPPPQPDDTDAPPPPPPPPGGGGPPPPPPLFARGGGGGVIAINLPPQSKSSPFIEKTTPILDQINNSLTKKKDNKKETPGIVLSSNDLQIVSIFKKRFGTLTAVSDETEFFDEMYDVINNNFESVLMLFEKPAPGINKPFSLFSIGPDDLIKKEAVQDCFTANDDKLKDILDKIKRYTNAATTEYTITDDMIQKVLQTFSMNKQSLSMLVVGFFLPDLTLKKNDLINKMYKITHVFGIPNVSEGEIAIMPYANNIDAREVPIVKFNGPVKTLFDAFRSSVDTYKEGEKVGVPGSVGLFSLRDAGLTDAVVKYATHNIDVDIFKPNKNAKPVKKAFETKTGFENKFYIVPISLTSSKIDDALKTIEDIKPYWLQLPLTMTNDIRQLINVCTVLNILDGRVVDKDNLKTEMGILSELINPLIDDPATASSLKDKLHKYSEKIKLFRFMVDETLTTFKSIYDTIGITPPKDMTLDEEKKQPFKDVVDLLTRINQLLLSVKGNMNSLNTLLAAKVRRYDINSDNIYEIEDMMVPIQEEMVKLYSVRKNLTEEGEIAANTDLIKKNVSDFKILSARADFLTYKKHNVARTDITDKDTSESFDSLYSKLRDLKFTKTQKQISADATVFLNSQTDRVVQGYLKDTTATYDSQTLLDIKQIVLTVKDALRVATNDVTRTMSIIRQKIKKETIVPISLKTDENIASFTKFVQSINDRQKGLLALRRERINIQTEIHSYIENDACYELKEFLRLYKDDFFKGMTIDIPNKTRGDGNKIAESEYRTKINELVVLTQQIDSEYMLLLPDLHYAKLVYDELTKEYYENYKLAYSEYFETKPSTILDFTYAGAKKKDQTDFENYTLGWKDLQTVVNYLNEIKDNGYTSKQVWENYFDYEAGGTPATTATPSYPAPFSMPVTYIDNPLLRHPWATQTDIEKILKEGEFYNNMVTDHICSICEQANDLVSNPITIAAAAAEASQGEEEEEEEDKELEKTKKLFIELLVNAYQTIICKDKYMDETIIEIMDKDTGIYETIFRYASDWVDLRGIDTPTPIWSCTKTLFMTHALHMNFIKQEEAGFIPFNLNVPAENYIESIFSHKPDVRVGQILDVYGKVTLKSMANHRSGIVTGVNGNEFGVFDAMDMFGDDVDWVSVLKQNCFRVDENAPKIEQPIVPRYDPAYLYQFLTMSYELHRRASGDKRYLLKDELLDSKFPYFKKDSDGVVKGLFMYVDGKDCDKETMVCNSRGFGFMKMTSEQMLHYGKQFIEPPVGAMRSMLLTHVLPFILKSDNVCGLNDRVTKTDIHKGKLPSTIKYMYSHGWWIMDMNKSPFEEYENDCGIESDNLFLSCIGLRGQYIMISQKYKAVIVKKTRETLDNLVYPYTHCLFPWLTHDFLRIYHDIENMTNQTKEKVKQDILDFSS